MGDTVLVDNKSFDSNIVIIYFECSLCAELERFTIQVWEWNVMGSMEYEAEGMPPKKRKPFTTTRLILLSFLLAILIGTAFLCLPISSASGEWTEPVTALFTATTSVCVTGLVVVDTCTYWSLFGQIVILILIQLGGLGILSFTTLLMLALGRRVTVRDRLLMMDAFDWNDVGSSMRFLTRAFHVTLVIEALGVCCYCFIFIPQFGFKGIWYSLFHSVSAFCNAGIDILGTDSLEAYVFHPFMNIVTITLTILGGIGFIVWWDLGRVFCMYRNKEIRLSEIPKKCSVHTKIVLITTGTLIILGMLLLFLLERDNRETIGDFSLPQKLMACLFQSVTTRTSGFAMISQKGLSDASVIICVILMFIGGSPVSTAGGVKTTTLAVAIIEAWSVIKGQNCAVVFQRTIPVQTMRRGIMVLVIFFFCFVAASLALLATSPGELSDILFETASALGSAGITRDYTKSLTFAGQCVIIACMYCGRIGPVSLALAFRKTKEEMAGWYKEEDVMIG